MQHKPANLVRPQPGATQASQTQYKPANLSQVSYKPAHLSRAQPGTIQASQPQPSATQASQPQLSSAGRITSQPTSAELSRVQVQAIKASPTSAECNTSQPASAKLSRVQQRKPTNHSFLHTAPVQPKWKSSNLISPLKATERILGAQRPHHNTVLSPVFTLPNNGSRRHTHTTDEGLTKS